MSRELPLMPGSDYTPGATLCYSAEQMRLYAQAAIDAAVAAERERCAERCELLASAAWALWATEADSTDQGKALAAEQLAADIRGTYARLSGRQRP